MKKKTHYIQNNPLLNSLIHNKSMLPRCAYEYILICIRTKYDVIRKQSLLIAKSDSKITG